MLEPASQGIPGPARAGETKKRSSTPKVAGPKPVIYDASLPRCRSAPMPPLRTAPGVDGVTQTTPIAPLNQALEARYEQMPLQVGHSWKATAIHKEGMLQGFLPDRALRSADSVSRADLLGHLQVLRHQGLGRLLEKNHITQCRRTDTNPNYTASTSCQDLFDCSLNRRASL